MNVYGGGIRPLRPVSEPLQPQPLRPARPEGDRSFSQMLQGFVDDVDGMQKAADGTVQDFAAGEVDNVHQVMSALGKAEISFKFMMEVRNRLIEAYQEIIRMPV